jgi:RND superfamily putative drug exporter
VTSALASWVLRHRGATVALWGVLIGAAALFASRLPEVLKGGSDGIPGSPSVQTIERAVGAGFPAGTFFPFLISLEHDRLTVHDPQFHAAADTLAGALEQVRGGGAVRSYWNTGRIDLLGKDRRTALILFRTSLTSLNEAEVLTGDVRAVVRQAALPDGFRALVTGTAPMYFDLDRQASADLLRAERIALPVMLVILLLAFRAPLAAGLPLVLALAAVTISAALLFFVGRVATVSVLSQNIVSIIGLGVGVDYALFTVSAFRRALAREPNAREAAARAVEEVGRTVLVCGLAVAIGFCALFLVNVPFLQSMAFGGIVVVLTAVAGALTLLPVVLASLGSWVNWPRRHHLPPAKDSGLFGRCAWLVMRRPMLSLVVGVAILAVCVMPALRLRTWNIGVRDLGTELEARQAYEVLSRDFESGVVGPTVLLVEAPPGRTVWDAAFRQGVSDLADRLAEDPRIARVTGFPDVVSLSTSVPRAVQSREDLPEQLGQAARDVISPGDRMALVVLLPSGPQEGAEAIALVEDLRRDDWPEFGGLPVRIGISGTAALTGDFEREVFSGLTTVLPVVLGVTFLVLLVTFRSVVIPLKAVCLNLLSVLASYGFLVYVFQDGYAANALGLTPPGGLNPFIVLVLFTMLFGLSMDYEVFLLGRVRDAYAITGDTRRAVSLAVQETAAVISSAAAIMVSIFTAFGFTQSVATRQFGLGLAFAIAIDATLVRLVLVPALMVLFGAANWWMPSWAGFTAKVGILRD